MTIDDKINMYYEQDGKCGICKEPLKDIWGQHTHVDHCHTREEGGEMYVRGLLCMHCNRMLGGARDNIDILKEGIKWLEQHLPT
ncbi:MAG: hypothetical protein B6U76_00005 [Desulfurococcales archaeon ex4484_217_2]|nr:MAG: hypothetical protein B6U76_00005 [Desulfurococcales archaeon ex4484_217_2]